MGSEKRRWVWVMIVAVVAALVWWLVPQGTSPSQEPKATSETDPARNAPTREAFEDPSPSVEVDRPPIGADSPDAPPTAKPLPRDEVALPATAGVFDAGVEDDEPPTDANRRRDAMLTTVLDRLEQDLRTAEEAGDEDRASQLRVRIERLEERRRELAEP
jgi:hypothetical protein